MDKKRLKKKLDRISAVFLVFYFGCYILLSLFGKYDDQLNDSANPKFIASLTATDTRLWEPKFLKLKSSDWNYGGLFYCPIIFLDRLVWHRNVKEIF